MSHYLYAINITVFSKTKESWIYMKWDLAHMTRNRNLINEVSENHKMYKTCPIRPRPCRYDQEHSPFSDL